MHCVDACVGGHADHEGIVGGGDVEVHGTKGHIQCQADVHVGELGLHTKEDGAARAQGLALRLVEAVGLRCRVQAALLLHRDEAVALLAAQRAPVEGLPALGALRAVGRQLSGLSSVPHPASGGTDILYLLSSQDPSSPNDQAASL